MTSRRVSASESARRAEIRRMKDLMMTGAAKAFSDREMSRNASIIVWTRGQMNGVRAMLKRLKMGEVAPPPVPSFITEEARSAATRALEAAALSSAKAAAAKAAKKAAKEEARQELDDDEFVHTWERATFPTPPKE